MLHSDPSFIYILIDEFKVQQHVLTARTVFQTSPEKHGQRLQMISGCLFQFCQLVRLSQTYVQHELLLLSEKLNELN